MSAARTVLAIAVVFVLASCGIGTHEPTLTPNLIPTPAPKSTASPAPEATATPKPQDVPIYQNSFEGITDPAASGITSNADVTLNSENFNYPGGGTALQIEGTLPGEQGSNLHVDLSIKELTGEESLDLADKTIYYSAFTPADSAIDKISLYAAGRNHLFVLLAEVSADAWWNKGVWHDYHFDLSHAQGAMKDCDTIRIAGVRLTSGDQTTAHFLVDDLKWIRGDSLNIPVDDSIDSLRKYAANRHFKFGLFSSEVIFGWEDDIFKNTKDDTRDPWYAYVAAQEGVVNVIGEDTPRPNEDFSNFDYDPVEDAYTIRQYNFGNANSMTTLGYGIGGLYVRAPEWLRTLDFPDATKALLLYHIERGLRLTRGQNPVWLLFNEFILGEGYGANGLKYRKTPLLGIDGVDYGDGDHYSPWAANRTDSSLIEAAFIKAHEVDPGATLLLNDYQDEQIGLKKSEYFYQLASDLKAKGIPIDGVGFQMHNAVEPEGTLTFMIPFTWPWQWQHIDLDKYLNNVDLNVKRYASIGMKVAFTEVEGQIKIDDLDLTSAADRAEYERRLQWQAEYFAGLLKIALENENVIMFNMWGGTDRYQNTEPVPGYGNGFIFDKNYNPKPAYDAMLELLKGQ